MSERLGGDGLDRRLLETLKEYVAESDETLRQDWALAIRQPERWPETLEALSMSAANRGLKWEDAG